VKLKTIFSLEIAMNARFSIAALLTIALSLSAFVVPATAAGPVNKLLIAPGEPHGLPKFDFSSSTIPNFGLRVVSVRPDGRAYRMGLEPGDVILSLNGYRLTYSNSWNDALSRALDDGGRVRLRVRDVRTGLIRVRETRIDFGDGPIEHHFNVGPRLTVTTGGLELTR
jgi:membrane-associated protease RseP (regulator of RpoE activity)